MYITESIAKTMVVPAAKVALDAVYEYVTIMTTKITLFYYSYSPENVIEIYCSQFQVSSIKRICMTYIFKKKLTEYIMYHLKDLF